MLNMAFFFGNFLHIKLIGTYLDVSPDVLKVANLLQFDEVLFGLQVQMSNGRWYKLGQPVESGGWCRSSRSGDLAVWEIQMCLTDNLHNISLVTSSLLGKRKMMFDV